MKVLPYDRDTSMKCMPEYQLAWWLTVALLRLNPAKVLEQELLGFSTPNRNKKTA